MSDQKPPLAYSAAGVDIDAKMGAVSRARSVIRSTFTKGVVGDVGGFGGLFRPDFTGMTDPLLVASTDGVGTKIKVAIGANRHDTVGQDLVNHCVNDILVQGARPLFFLDYYAAGRLVPEIVSSVLEGIAFACRENGCALLGGETAEMPGMYAAGDYDLAGTIVGASTVVGSDLRYSSFLRPIFSNGIGSKLHLAAGEFRRRRKSCVRESSKPGSPWSRRLPRLANSATTAGSPFR